MTTVPCLGGPLHGERVTVDTWPPPRTVFADVPRPLRIAGPVDLDSDPTYEAPRQVHYTLASRPGQEPVYVTADYYQPRPFVPPIIGQHLAAIYEQHGLREGEHYIVNWEEP